MSILRIHTSICICCSHLYEPQTFKVIPGRVFLLVLPPALASSKRGFEWLLFKAAKNLSKLRFSLFGPSQAQIRA